MSSQPLFRFVHASNLELDRFCSAGGELSHDQGRLLIDAPFRAAERVFETALREQAELILLSGGVFEGRNPSTWGASFLARHCDRVARAGVQVVWADPGHERTKSWPRFLNTPKNLHILRSAETQSLQCRTRRSVDVEVHIGNQPERIRQHCQTGGGSAPPFRIGMLTQVPSNDAELDRPIDYWAIHSGDEDRSFATSLGMARAAGTVQPRHAGGTASGSCLLVEVGPGYSLGITAVETNSVRYHVERIAVDDSTNWEGLRRRLHSRTDESLQSTIADAVVFQWQFEGHGPVVDRLLSPDEATALQGELMDSFAARQPAAWLTPMALAPDTIQETRWQRDGSPFGMFVRSLDGLPTGSGEDVDLTRLSGVVVHRIDPSARQVARPHYQSSLKAGARRQAARVLADLSKQPAT